MWYIYETEYTSNPTLRDLNIQDDLGNMVSVQCQDVRKSRRLAAGVWKLVGDLSLEVVTLGPPPAKGKDDAERKEAADKNVKSTKS